MRYQNWRQNCGGVLPALNGLTTLAFRLCVDEARPEGARGELGPPIPRSRVAPAFIWLLQLGQLAKKG